MSRSRVRTRLVGRFRNRLRIRLRMRCSPLLLQDPGQTGVSLEDSLGSSKPGGGHQSGLGEGGWRWGLVIFNMCVNIISVSSEGWTGRDNGIFVWGYLIRFGQVWSGLGAFHDKGSGLRVLNGYTDN